MNIKVTLRQKAITKGRKSLYLDFYPAIKMTSLEKETRREFLGLYINDKPKNPLERQDNKQTLLLAEQIRQKRKNELNKPQIYTPFEIERIEAQEKGKISFITYFEQIMDKRKGKNYDVWSSSIKHLKAFTNDTLKFADLNEKFCNDFKEYLLNAKSVRNHKNKLAQNTCHTYFNKFKAALKQAYKDDILPFDLNGKIERIIQADTNMVFLTLEELNKLANAECPNQQLKQASIFSALTGLRFSDVAKLEWGEITHTNGEGYSIQFKQKKTQSYEYSPIPDQAFEILGDRKEPNQRVFEGLTYSSHQNNQLLKWAVNAKIPKHITFHSFRHTYAVLQLKEGTDIVTISKMLGHKSLKTTQIYAKVVDSSKRKTTSKIKLNFN